MESNTGTLAKKELDLLIAHADKDDRPIVEPFIPEILALVEKFGLSGQSGGSAPFTASALAGTVKALCLQQPLLPLFGDQDEWVDVTDQNNDVKLF
jgi:hypothetical protein